ncbi:hypothetical protein HGP16_32240 [Rhizobium sp. P40RR-XXII]|uniref:hypothetical protein n=1 Tax=unclassified Rhizobium TaxID=2613769 RepID=UPI00145662F9|nr:MULTISPECIES: hypothetical protein [unclassified Rhizobium]NLR89307.1 hypothetical protein [Rhizobium sp. P28RR-XV]NLS21169.1 hypothetical protein [Rhizobium sp. P40RR-XXII]
MVIHSRIPCYPDTILWPTKIIHCRNEVNAAESASEQGLLPDAEMLLEPFPAFWRDVTGTGRWRSPYPTLRKEEIGKMNTKRSGEVMLPLRPVKQSERLRTDTETFGYRILELDGAEIRTQVVLFAGSGACASG